jgi:type IX secretion system substrate protein
MKSGKLLGILLLLGMQTGAYGQVLFSERNSYDLASALFSSVIRIGDTLYLSGVASDTSQNFAQVQYPKNFVAVMDINGNDIAHHIILGGFKKDYETFAHTLIKTNTRGFALCGATIDTTLFQALFMQYDSVMNEKIIKEFKYPDSILFMEMESMVQLKDGNFIMAGDIQNSSGVASIALLKLDSAANIIWWKNYDPESLSDIYPEILQLTDTTLLVGCEHSNELESPYAITSQTKFIIIDTGANILNQWIDSNDSTFAPYGLLKTKDGGYAYCGRYMIRMSAPYDAPLTDGIITKLDSNFHLVWRKIFTDTAQVGGAILYQMHELSDGSLVAAGGSQSWNSVSQTYEPTGWFVKISAAGINIWSRMYRGTPGYPFSANTNAINDFQLMQDGEIIGCGISSDNEVSYESQQAWLIRLDSMGCLIPGCDTLTATGLAGNLASDVHTGIAIYPNPASGLVYLLIKTDSPRPDLSFNVFDVNGRLIATELGASADVTYLLHINRYARGTYFVQVLNEGDIVATGKFVKE